MYDNDTAAGILVIATNPQCVQLVPMMMVVAEFGNELDAHGA
jgi:hypothetical protein